ncbi:MAG: hypothetical protein ABEK01_01385 [Candidatus Nanohaloarchaea archaeon]
MEKLLLLPLAVLMLAGAASSTSVAISEITYVMHCGEGLCGGELPEEFRLGRTNFSSEDPELRPLNSTDLDELEELRGEGWNVTSRTGIGYRAPVRIERGDGGLPPRRSYIFDTRHDFYPMDEFSRDGLSRKQGCWKTSVSEGGDFYLVDWRKNFAPLHCVAAPGPRIAGVSPRVVNLLDPMQALGYIGSILLGAFYAI